MLTVYATGEGRFLDHVETGAERDSAAALDSPAAEVAAAARTQLPIVISGLDRVGCRQVARQIHELSVSAAGPFLEVPVERVAEALGRHSDGTLFVSDLASLDQTTQTELMTLLDCRSELDRGPRIISATSEPPLALIAAGRLRPGLYYRLNAVHLKGV